jgi:alcohol dehydrogenase (cytochrome c)
MRRLLALALPVILVALAHGQEAQAPRSSTQISRAPAFTPAQLTALPTEAWLTNGGDLFNRRYSPLNQITRDNVAGLKGVWRTRLGGSGLGDKYSGEAQPIVFEGVIYVVTGADDVFAVSVDTGQILWTYHANLDPANDVVCCGWTSRGVALGEGKVYVGQLDGKLVALDQQSGAVTWSVQAERWQEGFSITSAPLYYDGLVITGFAGAEYGIRGRVKAYDASDGALVWTFYTVPGPGEIGHDTWPQDNDVWQRGGASVWQTPAVDPELGLIYFSTGNPGPDFSGAVRKGDNLFSSSIVAVEAKTGTYRWHFQQVHHDLWDYDAPSPVVLFDIEIDGRMRKAAAEPGKTGWVYILDRATGEPLIGINERPVPQNPRQATSPTQPYPVGDAFVPQSIAIAPEGFQLVNGGRIFTPFDEQSVVAKPGQGGGANWPPSSYDPTTGYLYVCAQDRTGIFTGGAQTDEPHTPGDLYIGGAFGSVTWGVTGIFSALDMRTNTLVWQQQWPERCYSGSVTTAGGLVFIGRGDGRFTALDATDGTLLWQFQTGAGVNAPATVFEHRGRQHVVVFSAGNLFAGTPRGDSLWLFSLPGHLGPVDPPGVQPAASTTPPGPVADGPADLVNGRAVFQSVCSACHGVNGEGGHGGGPPLSAITNPAEVTRVLNEGRNLMPAFGQTLSTQDIRDVVAHVTEGLPR